MKNCCSTAINEYGLLIGHECTESDGDCSLRRCNDADIETGCIHAYGNQCNSTIARTSALSDMVRVASDALYKMNRDVSQK